MSSVLRSLKGFIGLQYRPHAYAVLALHSVVTLLWLMMYQGPAGEYSPSAKRRISVCFGLLLIASMGLMAVTRLQVCLMSSTTLSLIQGTCYKVSPLLIPCHPLSVHWTGPCVGQCHMCVPPNEPVLKALVGRLLSNKVSTPNHSPPSISVS